MKIIICVFAAVGLLRLIGAAVYYIKDKNPLAAVGVIIMGLIELAAVTGYIIA